MTMSLTKEGSVVRRPSAVVVQERLRLRQIPQQMVVLLILLHCVWMYAATTATTDSLSSGHPARRFSTAFYVSAFRAPYKLCGVKRDPCHPSSRTGNNKKYHHPDDHQRLYASSPSEQEDVKSTSSNFFATNAESFGVNGASPPSSSSKDTGGGLITMEDTKSQLFSSFAALDLPDQYDAVLTGLCAKILDQNKGGNDGGSKAASNIVVALQDPIQLLQEMNAKRIIASPRSVMALIDSSAKSQDAKTMSRILSLAMKNRSIRNYGSLQADIVPLPTNPTSKVKCPDGSMKTRQQRLLDVPDVPFDDRSKEVSAALTLSALVGACLFLDVTHMDDVTPFTNLLLTGVVTVGIIDNFYDLIKTGTAFASKELNKNKEKTGGSNENNTFQLPDKESLPFGLGSGRLSGDVLRGLTRLLTVDAERESQCEAAALYAAYMLGLPCFAFRPNAFESAVLMVESTRNDNNIDSLDSSAGIMKILVWLLAPVAMESMKHPQLIMSDPREAEGFLQRLEDLVRTQGGSGLSGSTWWVDDEKERADLIKWAYTEADVLIRDHRNAVNEIGQCLTGGAATIGDCVAIMEKWS